MVPFSFILCGIFGYLARNNLIFNFQVASPEKSAKKGMAEVVEFCYLANSQNPIPRTYNISIKWFPPKEGWLKLNSDGACSGNPSFFSVLDLPAEISIASSFGLNSTSF
ncbi:reverse transcriptase [Senna tora]|uniref:Reverse transcriptase n=1 Tax=Senna tora TaxID=362788 RepID=A0A834XG23_9FABA|nr:reverse transcriptase [Senna tora]